MKTYSTDSGIAVTEVRISNFRSLSNIEVLLSDLTVLIGSNNAGKTSFMDALFSAIGAGRKSLTVEDIRLENDEALVPRERRITIDVRMRPINEQGSKAETFPPGSYWTALWGSSILVDTEDFKESLSFRTVLKWDDTRDEYVVERLALKEWNDFNSWLEAETHDKMLSAAQIEPIALHYIDAKRDLEDDLRRQGSFWRKLTDNLGLEDADITDLENDLSEINQKIVERSDVLQHLKQNLADLQTVVASNNSGIEISPVSRKLRDLSKGIDVSFSTCGAQSFPLSRHGMGTRSLASLLVFRAYTAWRTQKITSAGAQLHSILALEEPESHLHPHAQRSLFGHIKAISGQRIVSTHSPYFVGQADLDDFRLFIKSGDETQVTQLDTSTLQDDKDRRKLQETVIESRGDILFARAIIMCEGQTEEQALPIWAQSYWGANIHELGFSIVRVNGTDYFPYIWLANKLQIPWFVFGDGEALPIKDLEKALSKANHPNIENSTNIVIAPNGRNFESVLIDEGYHNEINEVFNEIYNDDYLNCYIRELEGAKGGGGIIRDYSSEGGRERAMVDAMSSAKTMLAKPLAKKISSLTEYNRRFPSTVQQLFEKISSKFSLSQKEDEVL